MSGLDKSQSAYLTHVKQDGDAGFSPSCGDLAISSCGSDLCHFVPDGKNDDGSSAPQENRAFTWNKTCNGSVFKFKACTGLTHSEIKKVAKKGGDMKDSKKDEAPLSETAWVAPSICRKSGMNLVFQKSGYTFDFNFAKKWSHSQKENEGTKSEQMNWGVVDWGQFRDNFSFFSGGAFSSECNGAGKAPGKVGYKTFLGGIWTAGNYTWTGSIVKDHLEGEKFFNEGQVFKHGPFSFASQIRLKLGNWSFDNLEKYDAIFQYKPNDKMAFWLHHESPPKDDKNAGTAGTGGNGKGDGKGAKVAEAGFFKKHVGKLTFSGAFALPEKTTSKPVHVGLELARDTATGAISWATGVKCVESGCQAGFDSDFNFSFSSQKKWGGKVNMTNWFAFPVTQLTGGNFGNLRNWCRWGMKMSLD